MNQKKRSKKQEKRVASELNGKPTIASGALYFQKADVRADRYLCECKYTDKEYYSLTLETWEKIAREALRDGMRAPVMCIELPDVSVAVLDVNEFADRLSSFNPFRPECLIIPKRPIQKSIRIKAEQFRLPLEYPYHLPYYIVKFEGVSLVLLKWEDFIAIHEL